MELFLDANLSPKHTMKTEYQVTSVHLFHPWTNDLTHLRENYRKPGAKLFRREVETPEDAAVRRMAWLEMRCKETVPQPNGDRRMFVPCDLTISDAIDRHCPPPPIKEVQVDWDTLEPIKEVPVWFSTLKNVWAAGIDHTDWIRLEPMEMAQRITKGQVAIGHTRESALRNLAELQGGRK